MGRGSCVSSTSKWSLKYERKSEKRCKRQVQSSSFLPRRLHGCILFEVGCPVDLPWQVNRGPGLAATVGTGFTMCKYCIVLVCIYSFH